MGRKSVSLFTLVLFIIFIMSCVSYKNGAKIVIVKTDNQKVKGVLLKVNEKSLILKESTTPTGLTIYIDEIKKITIRGRRSFWRGLKVGFEIGFGVGTLGGWSAVTEKGGKGFGEAFLIGTISGTITGIVFGAIYFAINAASAKHFIIEGKNPEEMDSILKELKSKSIYRD